MERVCHADVRTRACAEYPPLTASAVAQASQVLQKHAAHDLYLTTPSGAALQPGVCVCVCVCVCVFATGRMIYVCMYVYIKIDRSIDGWIDGWIAG
jgi:hypothetical protein